MKRAFYEFIIFFCLTHTLTCHRFTGKTIHCVAGWRRMLACGAARRTRRALSRSMAGRHALNGHVPLRRCLCGGRAALWTHAFVPPERDDTLRQHMRAAVARPGCGRNKSAGANVLSHETRGVHRRCFTSCNGPVRSRRTHGFVPNAIAR